LVCVYGILAIKSKDLTEYEKIQWNTNRAYILIGYQSFVCGLVLFILIIRCIVQTIKSGIKKANFQQVAPATPVEDLKTPREVDNSAAKLHNKTQDMDT